MEVVSFVQQVKICPREKYVCQQSRSFVDKKLHYYSQYFIILLKPEIFYDILLETSLQSLPMRLVRYKPLLLKQPCGSHSSYESLLSTMLISLQKVFDQIPGKNYLINDYVTNCRAFVHQSYWSIFEFLGSWEKKITCITSSQQRRNGK